MIHNKNMFKVVDNKSILHLRRSANILMGGIWQHGLTAHRNYLAVIHSSPQREKRDKDRYIKERVDQCRPERHALSIVEQIYDKVFNSITQWKIVFPEMFFQERGL